MSEENLIFGLHAVTKALQVNAATISSLWVDKRRKDERFKNLLGLAATNSVTVTAVSAQELDNKLPGVNHQGVLAVCDQSVSYSEADLPGILESIDGHALVLVLDGIQDPHNLGACLRSADAAGVHVVIAPKDKSASLTGVVRKVASGAAEHVPFIQVTNLARTLRTLKDTGIWLVGTTGEADKSLYEMDLKGPVAIVMGGEGKGLRRLTQECCDYLAALPMAGIVESLNVSVATGITLFEAVRQRKAD